jgi:hypothetical protein
MTRHLAAALALGLVPVAPGADGPRPAAPDGPPLVEARMADGSVVKLTLAQPHLVVVTRFGKLSVPAADVRRLEIGLRTSPEVLRRIEADLADLASEDFPTRERASNDLMGLREHAYHAVRARPPSADKEAARRVADVLDRLSDELTEEERALKTHDTVQTDDSVVHGRVEGATLRARSAILGEVSVPLVELRALRRLAGGVDKGLTLDAAKYGVPGQVWLDTGLEVGPGAVLAVRATGEVDLYPIGREKGAYRTSPAGSTQWGVARGDGHPPGALLGRIGPKGPTFVIGDTFEGRAEATGRLYLRVGGSPWNNVPAGSYKVKVSVR